MDSKYIEDTVDLSDDSYSKILINYKGKKLIPIALTFESNHKAYRLTFLKCLTEFSLEPQIIAFSIYLAGG